MGSSGHPPGHSGAGQNLPPAILRRVEFLFKVMFQQYARALQALAAARRTGFSITPSAKRCVAIQTGFFLLARHCFDLFFVKFYF
jgi:hypothetical protein